MSGSVPPSSRRHVKVSKATAGDIKRAANLYERFTGHDPEVVGKIRVIETPKVGIDIGDVDGILYTTIRDGVVEKYIHKFAPKDKPMLVVSPDGKSIHIVGGHYRFTSLGIVDRSDTKHRGVK